MISLRAALMPEFAFALDVNLFQPNTADTLPEKDMALHRFQVISKISIITYLTDPGRKE